MSKVSQQTMDEYRRILAKDPNSKVFAPLAEALRENLHLPQAEKVALDGVKRHPDYVGGYVALGRTLIDQMRYKEALPVLKRGTEIDPENILALQLLATTHLQLQNHKEALRAFKWVLFLNPLSEKAKNAVQKLETLSAEDYEEDSFQFQKWNQQLGSQNKNTDVPSSIADTQPLSMAGLQPKELERKLSLVDALIVRNDLERAREALIELSLRAPGNLEIAQRFDLLDEAVPEEEAADLHPLLGREKQILERKQALLENLLRRVKKVREESIARMT